MRTYLSIGMFLIFTVFLFIKSKNRGWEILGGVYLLQSQRFLQNVTQTKLKMEKGKTNMNKYTNRSLHDKAGAGEKKRTIQERT